MAVASGPGTQFVLDPYVSDWKVLVEILVKKGFPSVEVATLADQTRSCGGPPELHNAEEMTSQRGRKRVDLYLPHSAPSPASR